jgi:ABC-2 type transport system ATP-binding protein
MNAISIKKLTKTYSDGTVALKNIDLEVASGEFCALLGANGAGKTTIIGIITGLVNKTSGRVKLFDHDIDIDHAAAKKSIGVVPQEMNFGVFERVEDIVVNQGGYFGIDRKTALNDTQGILKALHLWDKRHQIARNLSGGMKRRLMIARALIHEPKLLILDEPTAGVDIELRRSMWTFLQRINGEGTTIILTTHYLEEAESLCRNIAIIDRGEIRANTSKRELLARLHSETFVLDVTPPLQTVPVVQGYPIELSGDRSLLVEVEKEQGLNNLFQQLADLEIKVVSMRNKTNRLEELFVRLVENNLQ